MRDVRRPAPTRDLDRPEEIAEMVRRFYADVAQDDLLGPMFDDVAQVDWSEHLPKLTAFWCRALLGLPGYAGNPFRAHSLVHARRAFRAAHFERWLTLFHETLDLGWVGENAERARSIADDVARVHSQQLVGHAVGIDHPATSRPRSASAVPRRPLACGARAAPPTTARPGSRRRRDRRRPRRRPPSDARPGRQDAEDGGALGPRPQGVLRSGGHEQRPAGDVVGLILLARPVLASVPVLGVRPLAAPSAGGPSSGSPRRRGG